MIVSLASNFALKGCAVALRVRQAHVNLPNVSVSETAKSKELGLDQNGAEITIASDAESVSSYRPSKILSYVSFRSKGGSSQASQNRQTLA
jgi:hypothetical protein